MTARFFKGGVGPVEIGIERIGLGLATAHDVGEVGPQRVLHDVRPGAGPAQSKTDLGGLAGRQGHAIPGGGLGAGPLGIDARRAVQDVVVDAVLGERRGRRLAEEPLDVGLVLAQQELRTAAVRPDPDIEDVIAELRMHRV